MKGVDALRASNATRSSDQTPKGAGCTQVGEATMLRSSGLGAGSYPPRLATTLLAYYTLATFIRAASRCVSFVEGYRSMWLQPIEQCTQRATTPVKACGKKVCRLSPPLHPPLLGSLADHGAHSHEPSGTCWLQRHSPRVHVTK